MCWMENAGEYEGVTQGGHACVSADSSAAAAHAPVFGLPHHVIRVEAEIHHSLLAVHLHASWFVSVHAVEPLPASKMSILPSFLHAFHARVMKHKDIQGCSLQRILSSISSTHNYANRCIGRNSRS